MIPSMVNGKYTIRFCITYEHATEQDIGKCGHAWTNGLILCPPGFLIS